MAKYRANSTDLWKTLKIKALDSMVIGSVIDYAGKEEKIPAGWLICDGSAISRTEYSELFDAIGTKWGTGDGSTTFNIPPAGIVRVGYDANDTDFNAVGKTGGEKAVQLTTDNLASNVISTATTGSNSDGYIMRGGYTASGTYNIGGSGVAHNNIQPYGTFYTIIKAKNTTPTMASIVDAYSTSTQDGYSCDYSNKHYGGVVLWTNPHPDYEFDAQSVSIDLSNYRYIEIYYTRWQGTTLLYHKIYFEENSTIYSQLTYSDYDSGEVRSWNRILTINNSGIAFNVNQINGATSNYGLIPYKIIGYK